MPKNVLLTDRAGHIGSYACKLLTKKNFPLLAFDSLTTVWAQTDKCGALEQGDLMDHAAQDAAPAKHKPVAVTNSAAFSKAGAAVTDPGKHWCNNVLASLNLVEAVAAECRATVSSSTCATYGEQDGDLLAEDSAPPTNPFDPIDAGGYLWTAPKLVIHNDACATHDCTCIYPHAMNLVEGIIHSGQTALPSWVIVGAKGGEA